MALSKVMWAALKTITALEPNVKKTYKMERFVQVLTAKLRGYPKLYRIWDHCVYADGYAIPIRFFAPHGEGPFPLLLFFHGGGWVTGGTENYAAVCGNLAMATGCIVASVDYRLAPEHKFPTARIATRPRVRSSSGGCSKWIRTTLRASATAPGAIWLRSFP